MPVANNMKKPQHFLGCPSVLNITMTIVVVLYAVMGVFGYLAYGEKAEASITLNLPKEETWVNCVFFAGCSIVTCCRLTKGNVSVSLK